VIRVCCLSAKAKAMSSRIRVLHVAAGNLYGGVETCLVTFARYRERVHELDSEFALCFEGRLAKELRSAGAFVHLLGEVRLRRPLSVARANLAFARVLRHGQYDAIITHGAWPHVLFGPSARLHRKKLVTWNHGAPLDVSPLDRLADIIRPDLLIANSVHTFQVLGPRLKGVRKEVIYYPVEPGKGSAKSRTLTRRQLNTPEDAVVIAFAARLERWKGQDLLLRALRVLRDEPGWRLWLSGGAQRPHEQEFLLELRDYAEREDLTERMDFLGQRSDVPDLLRAADIFCQPNTAPEPFGIVLVEALYAGLPVVATKMGGAEEIVDSSCGILVEPTGESVAAGLRLLIRDGAERRRFASAGPDRARQLCDPEARIRDIARAIRLIPRAGMPHELPH
jgi:glycosyltransferase involved in cell wall biosynthesis